MDKLFQRSFGSRDAEIGGPRAALAAIKLDAMCSNDRRLWVEEARLNAILGGLKLSMKSFQSGLRCYCAFIGTHHITSAIVLGSCRCGACARCLPAGHQVIFPAAAEHLARMVHTFQAVAPRHSHGRAACGHPCV